MRQKSDSGAAAQDLVRGVCSLKGDRQGRVGGPVLRLNVGGESLELLGPIGGCLAAGNRGPGFARNGIAQSAAIQWPRVRWLSHLLGQHHFAQNAHQELVGVGNAFVDVHAAVAATAHL